jgi:signal peptidase I
MRLPISHNHGLRALIALTIGALWIVFLRPQSLGGPAAYLRISGSSMLPAITNGDFVLIHKQASYAVGDVVVYRAAGLNVIHRIVGGSGAEGYTVKGDNNRGVDPWTPTNSQIMGKAWIQIPGLGALAGGTRQPAFLALVAGGLALLLLTL